MRSFLRVLVVLPLWILACASGEVPVSPSSGTSSGGGGAGGAEPCGMDCATIETAPCMVAVCNTGQVAGPVDTCVVVPSPKGTKCDDGQFCTLDDVCDNGTCLGVTKNICGLPSTECVDILCYEDTKTCDVMPANDGAGCVPTDPCQIEGVCHVGECLGLPKDCSFSPLHECNTMSCDPATGKCVGTPDPSKDDSPCHLSGDLCSLNKTCMAGHCKGGLPKDCSSLSVGCQVGVCDASTGLCGLVAAAVGDPCTDGISECHVGVCDPKGTCAPSAAPDGTTCNDHNACTASDTCVTGACTGASVAGCKLYFQEGFETCPGGWAFGGDWQCGTPSNVGPSSAHTGGGVIATKIAGVYSVNQSFTSTVADSPPISLAGATNPMVTFWAWDNTEGDTFDGWNLKISNNNGVSFKAVSTVTPAYPLTVAGQPSWGGDHATEGWQIYYGDLTSYAGQTVILRFAFRSDGATVYPGVYVDDMVVAEPQQIPLYITTSPSLPDVYAGVDYAAPIAKSGGTGNVVWSKAGGMNAGWLDVDPATGMLTGHPTAAEVGPVTVTVHVEEQALPSNFAEKTFSLTVVHDAYYTSFESCPNGWTLAGDWQCGIPTNVGPATGYVGKQCLGTQLAANYSNLQAWAGSIATSPDIPLIGVLNPTMLTFRMWVDTEGATYDGVNLKISNDGGTTYTVLDTVTPAYALTIAGEPAWGGHQANLGWQLVQADLSPYAGQTVRLRFAFHTDSSGTSPGVYLDDMLIQ